MFSLIITCISTALLCCVFLYILYYYITKDKRLDEIPGPPGYPVIGNTFVFLTSLDNLWKVFRKLGRTYYPIYKVSQFAIPIVVIINPEDVKIVMSSSVHITKGIIYTPLQNWLNTGLLTSTGKKWQHRRKLLTSTFHFNILQQFIPTFKDHIQALIKRLEDECSKPFTDVIPLLTETMLLLISETAMGTRLKPNNKLAKEYMQSIHRMGELFIQILANPLIHVIITAVFIPTYWEFKKLIGIVHKFTANVINERKETFDQNSLTNKRLALLDFLLKAQKTEKSIDDDGIREEVNTFMFAGHDTTTACISFTLMLLANHPDVQNKVVDELRHIFEDSDRMPTYQDLQNMNYLEQVLKESLRLYPSVPTISRMAGEDFQTSSNYTIPKGTEILIGIYDLHHNEEIFPDPEKFDPDRFLPENSKDRHPYAYVPFSAGPRNCLGQRFTLLEIKTVISSILRKFELLPVDTPSSITLTINLILRSKNGIKVKFVRRV